MKMQLLFYWSNAFLSGLGGERQTKLEDLHVVWISWICTEENKLSEWKELLNFVFVNIQGH